MSYDPLRISGFGGIDIEQLVKAVMLPEEQRLASLESRRADFSAEQRAWQDLDSRLDALLEALERALRESPLAARRVENSRTDLVTAAVSPGAPVGTYRIEVIQLAAPHILMGEPLPIGEPLGLSGTIRVNGSPVAITAAMTLAGIRDAINAAGTGVTASIVDGRLFLSGAEGSQNRISLMDDGGVLEQLGILDASGQIRHEQQAPADAVLRVNGLTVVRSTNRITDLMDGLTLELHRAEAGTAVSLAVSADLDADAKAAMDLIGEINRTIDLIRKESSDGGRLRREVSTLAVLERRIRQALLDPVASGDGAYRYAFALGLSTGRDGRIQVQESDLRRALAEDPAGIRAYLLGEGGALARVREVLREYAGLGGILERRQESAAGAMRRLDQQIQRARYLNARRAERVRSQFIRMQQIMLQMSRLAQGWGGSVPYGQ